MIGDTGVHSPTAAVVSDCPPGLGKPTEQNSSSYLTLLQQIADAARRSIEQAGLDELGPLMNENQALLQPDGRLIARAGTA